MIGTLINFVLILIGTLLGLLLRKGIPERIRSTVMQALSLCVILIGATGALGIDGTAIHPIDTLCVIICMAVGSILGSVIDIEKRLDQLGQNLEKRFAGNEAGTGSVAKGFVTSSLVYCVGAMAIVGAINSGIRGDHSTLIAKGIIDGISAIFFTSALGWGVGLSAVSVLIYQGLIALLAGWLSPLLTADIIQHMSAIGGLLIIGVGLNLMRDRHIPVGNMLPAIFLPMLYLPLTGLLG